MKKYIFTLLFLAITSSLFAQSDHPVLKKSAATVKDFIPNGWKMIYEAKGDLNKDLQPDVALIIQNTNPKNLVLNDGLGTDTLNVNPRILMILFKQTNGSYQLVAKNSSFIPTENDAESPCLADPLSETGAIAVKKGSLILSYNYWVSCGSYGVSTNNYTFRYQNKKFELIGFDSKEFSRSTGEENSMSVNFSTNKMKIIDGGNMFEEKNNKPKIKTKNIAPKKLFDLETITIDAVEKLQLELISL